MTGMSSMNSARPLILRAAVLLLCLGLLSPRPARAIGELTGSIGGVVQIGNTSDGLAGVRLSVRSKALIGGAQSITTNDDGSYVFQNLPPGTYELSTQIEGFTPVLQKNIAVNAGQLSAVDIRLQIQTSPQQGDTYQIIEKINPVLNHESAAAVTTIGNKQLTSAPSFRQEKGVAQFAPGVTQGTDKASVRGGLGRWNRFYIDGLDVTDITLGAFGTSSALINSDSVEQFVVAVGAMDAEYNSLGLVQNMVTRSGGNKFTADASVILQPPFLASTARYPARGQLYDGTILYDDRRTPDRSFYSVNVNLGGPIVKDRLWFFTSFQFNFNRLTFNIQEQPWYPGLEKPYDRYQDQTLYLGRVKLTWQATSKTRISLAYSLDRNYISNASTSSAIVGVDPSTLAPEAERRVERGGDWITLLVDSALTPKLLFQLQAGVNYKHYLEDSLSMRDGRPDRLTPSHTLSTSDASNNFTYLNGNRDWDDQGKWNLQLAPTLLYTALGLGGTHNIKGGMQLSYMRYDHNVGVPGGMRFTDTVPGLPCDPNNSATFASCSQVEVFKNSLPQNGAAGPGYSTTSQAVNLGFFIQDRYTFRRWLSIVPGMRVDLGLIYDTTGQRVAALVGYGPRLSVIYDILHDHSTLLMAHYGRHNDVGNAFIGDRSNPLQESSLQQWVPSMQRFQEVRRSGGPGAQSFSGQLTPPKLDEVSVGVHREIFPLTVVGVDYTYRHYGNLWVNEEVNQLWDPAGTRVVGYVNGQPQRLFQASTPDDAQRTYHGLDLWVRGSPGRWDLTASYTLASLNGTVGDYFETAGYRYNPRLNTLFNGPLPGNSRHYLKGLVSYNFPFGLTLGTRFQYLSGSSLWEQFRSPEDKTYTLYRTPRGSSAGTRLNDPATWVQYALPDQVVLDLQVGMSLERWTRQRIDINAMVFNVLNLATATQVETRQGATFGQVTRRPDPALAEIVLRYRY